VSQIITVNFRGDELYGFENDDGTFIALKPIVESIGMDWSGQFQRVKRDPILSEGMCVIPIPFGRGGAQDATCLKLDLVNGWLFTIDSARIRDESVREKVILYQRECYRVLSDHFSAKKKAPPLPGLSEKPIFPEWPMDEMRTKRGVADMYRMTYGAMAAQWIMPQLGFPIPPIETVEHGRQFTMTLVPKQEAA
jgi:hypothetical protein